MSRAESGSPSTETAERGADSSSAKSYISPLADFLLLFLLTVVGAGAVVVLL
jgi:hypothetical protein